MRRLGTFWALLLTASAAAAADKFPAAGYAGDIEITPIIHSSVQIEFGGRVVHVDPWSVGDLTHAKPADLILITDDPIHHLDVKAIALLRKPGAPVVVPAVGKSQVPDGLVLANGESRTFGAIRVEAIPAYDLKPGAPEHPKGKSNGYVVTVGGRRFYFSGVTECVPEVEALKDIDVAFMPMNIPVERMMPAAAAACVKTIKPKVVYVYHYDQDFASRAVNPNARQQGIPGGLTVAQSLDAFREAMSGTSIEFRRSKWYPHEPDPIGHDINALSAQCPSASEVKAIDHDLKLVFENDPTRGSTHECTDANGKELSLLQSRVYRALATMKKLEFSEPLPWTKEPVYRWLTKSVRGVRFTANANTSSCCGPDGLITVRTSVETSADGRQSGFALAITQAPQMATDFRLLATFLQLLVHEGRHNNGKPHTCGTKDKSISELGAWGSAYTFQKWLVEKTAPDLVPVSVKLNLKQAMDQICKFQICSGPCGLP